MTMSFSSTSLPVPSVPVPVKTKRGWNNPFKKNSKSESAEANPISSLPSISKSFTSPQDQAGQVSNTRKLSPLISRRKIYKKVGVVSKEEYGYEEAVPDYGYGPAEPNSESVSTSELYGYGDATPDCQTSQPRKTEEPRPRRVQRRSSMPCSTTGGGAAPRRSSMKQVGSPTRESITNKGEIEVYLPPTKKGEGRQVIKRRTSLTFSDQPTVTPIEPAKNLARSPEDLWFQDYEMHQIRKKVSTIILKTEDGCTPHNGKRYCMRGLERLMEPQVVAVKRNQAWDTVFKEQYLQKCEGVYEVDHLANLYKFSTLRSKKDAEARASNDAKEVEKYLREERHKYRRMSM